MNQNELTSQKYTPVLKKFFGANNWPRQNVILPGNEVLFSLETASDYVKDDKVRIFGLKVWYKKMCANQICSKTNTTLQMFEA